MSTKITKYQATFIGLITTAICLVIYAGAFILPFFLMFIFLFNLGFLPFYFLGGLIFGETNDLMIETTALIGELILLIVLCVIYFRKLVEAEKKQEKFNTTRLIVFFVFLQFMIHPIGFFSWLLLKYSGDHQDPMILFYSIETFSYTACVSLFLGIIIDWVRNRLLKRSLSA